LLYEVNLPAACVCVLPENGRKLPEEKYKKMNGREIQINYLAKLKQLI